MTFDEANIRRILLASWSIESAEQWTRASPASGQCNVTAALVQALFGGDILKTPLPGVMHYYNRINGQVVDFTDIQFAEPVAYQNLPSNRDEALKGIADCEYGALKSSFLKNAG